MKKTLIAGLSIVAASAVPISGAFAQNTDIVGMWRCEHGIQPISDPNLSPVYVVFDIQILANGTMRAAGIANQINQFQAEGRWELQGTRFNTQGQMQDAMGLTPFGFSSLVTSGTTMNERSRDQVNQYASACQKEQ